VTSALKQPPSARQLNRATLARQLLLRRERLGAVEAVHRVTALQAQEPASPYIALWNRVEDFDPSELDRAFTEHRVVKATLMRVTMHAVDAADYPAFHEAMQTTLRAARLYDQRFKSTGLTAADADAVIPDLLAWADRGRSNTDFERWVEQRYGTGKARLWWALRHYGPFVHTPTGGQWSFGSRPAYRGAVVQERPGQPVASLGRLIVRYLEGFGPATIPDIAGFGMLNPPLVRAAVEALRDALVRREGQGREPLYDVPHGLIPDEDVVAPPRLLGMWDETLLAYQDRTRVIPEPYRRRVIQGNGDVLPSVLVDGHVAGVWRPKPRGKGEHYAGIEVTAFHRLSADDWRGLESEAAQLVRFMRDRDPNVYGRYGRWWNGMEAAEVRVLG
jgi:hypothetical protein